jgi:hypothetical protein
MRRIAFFIGMVVCGVTWGAEVFVSPGGNDRDPGTREKPVKTLESARDRVRDLHAEKATVWLRGGRYELLKNLELTEADSGVEWRAMAGEEVRLTGSTALDAQAFKAVNDAAVLQRLPAEARGHVLQLDLKKAGVTDFGKMEMRGFGQPERPAPMELFFNDLPMKLARWPNDGYATYGAVIDAGSVPRNRDPMLEKSEQNLEPDRPGVFVYEGDRPARWVKAKDAWLFGYWAFDWADETIAIGTIDQEKHQITLAAPHLYGIQQKKRFYALNLLEELDQAGEYFLDREKGILYFWPPAKLETARVSFSKLTGPLVSMTNVHHGAVRDVVLEESRGPGLVMKGGHDNVIERCTVRNTGEVGIMIGQGDNNWSPTAAQYRDSSLDRNAGTNNGVRACTIYNTGAGGVIITGGDRKTLTPARNYVTETEIHNVGRWSVQNHPAINLDGVGNLVSHNLIHDCPHSAVMYAGNDHVIEFNEIARCVTDSADAGAIYAGRDPASRGNVIRNNYLHHIGPAIPREMGAQAIFFDDSHCGTEVYGNLFYKAGTDFVIKINGGCDHVVRNNIFVQCPKMIWEIPWDPGYWNGQMRTKLMVQRLTQAVDIRKPPYSTKYPKLANVLNESADVKRGNVVERNWETNDLSAFVDPANGNFELKPDAKVFAELKGFQPIPFKEIGKGKTNNPAH